MKNIYSSMLLIILLIGCAANDTKDFEHIHYEPETLDTDMYQNSVNCNNISTCTEILKYGILQKWKRPIGNYSVNVSISIDEFYEVSEVDIIDSSGSVNYDNSIVSAIWRSSPFKELEGLSEEDFQKIKKIELLFGARKFKRKKMKQITIGSGSSI